MNILDIPLRKPENPFLTFKETNALLTYLKGLSTSRRVETSNIGTNFRDTHSDNLTINCAFNIDIPSYSIFIMSDHGISAHPFYPAKAWNAGDERIDVPITSDPYPYFSLPNNYPYPIGVDYDPGYRTIYLTNESQPIVDTMTFDCPVIGTETARKVRYVGSDPAIGIRMEYVPNSFTITRSNQGPFVCVSYPDEIEKLVWIVAFIPEKFEIDWVRTTTDDRFSVPELMTYPSDPANVFVVERGYLGFVREPGNKAWEFVPFSPRQLFIAFNPCGFIPEGTISRMSYDHGFYYLFEECVPSSVSA